MLFVSWLRALFFVWCLSFDVNCSLIVARCMLMFVVDCVSFSCVSFPACCLLSGVCRLLFVVCILLMFVVCCLVLGDRCVACFLFVVCCLLCVGLCCLLCAVR